MNRFNRSGWVVCALVAGVLTGQALAVEPGERLADTAQEARARALSAELRCLVCQNQSIDDSNAPLAKDLRVLVREQIKAGKSDNEVMSYIVARYGDFVLLRPRVTLQTALLWLTPLLILGAVGYGFWRRRDMTAARTETAPLTADEQRRLDDILRAKDQR
jgi:cytochrome c-type biogenesis protein CcmH